MERYRCFIEIYRCAIERYQYLTENDRYLIERYGCVIERYQCFIERCRQIIEKYRCVDFQCFSSIFKRSETYITIHICSLIFHRFSFSFMILMIFITFRQFSSVFIHFHYFSLMFDDFHSLSLILVWSSLQSNLVRYDDIRLKYNNMIT